MAKNHEIEAAIDWADCNQSELGRRIGYDRGAIHEAKKRGYMSFEMAFKLHSVAPQFRISALTEPGYRERKAS